MPDRGKPTLAPEAGKQYLVFKEGNFTLALGLSAIKKLYDAEGFPPRTPGTRLLDLHDLMGAEFVARHGYWIEMEAGSTRYLMPVEDVEGIRELSLAIVLAYPPVLRRPELAYIRGIFFDGLRMIVELDPEQMAKAGEGIGMPGPDAGPGAHAGGELSMPGKKSAGPEPDEERTLVLFEGGGALWSLDLGSVVQIINKDEVHPIPAAGRGIKGVVYYAEQAVPVIAPATLHEIVGVKQDAPGEEFSIVLVVETTRGLLGFGCDHMVRVDKQAAATPSREGARDITAVAAARELKIEDVLRFLA